MEIKVIKIEEDEYGEGGSFELFVDGKSKIYASKGEPEDMILSRDLNFVYGIPKLLQDAYDAGKRGEEFSIKRVIETDNLEG